MKKLVAFALLLSLGVFTLGCEKKKEAAPAGGEPAAPAEGAAPAGDAAK